MGIEGVPQPIGFDTSRTFVRVVEHRPDGFVEFHFSIGEPSLFVEMLLTEPAFAEFCALHRTELLRARVLLAERKHAMADLARSVSHDVNNWDWTMRDAAQRRFR
ncbi:MAG: phenol hydroxylase subunit [Ilumatobacteraceae bacterium]